MTNPTLIPSVLNTTALAALGAASSQYGTVFVSGTNVTYTWAPASTATADGVYVIAASGVTTGRWIMDQPTTLVTKGWRNIFELIIADSNGPAIIDGIQSNTQVATLDSFFAAAIAIGGSWYFPPGTYFLNTTVNMAAGVEFHGAGMGNTILSLTGPSGSAWAMQMLNPNGTDTIEGFKLYDMTIEINGTCNGIRWNSETGGFTNDNTSQDYMMRAHMERVRLLPNFSYPNSKVGVNLNKCFDSVIQDCDISFWGTCVYFKGTDLSRITDNRLNTAYNQNIQVESVSSFGSGNRICHNDILQPGNGGNTSASALVTSDRDGYFCENYIEGFQAVTDAIQITGGYNHKIDDNRIEWALATNVLRVRSSAISGNALYGVSFCDNHTTGAMGQVTWEGNKGYYFNNSATRSFIFVQGNTAVPTRIPFNSSQDDSPCFGRVAYFTSGRSGVACVGLATNVLCDGGDFSISPNSDTSQYLQFSDYSEYNLPSNKLIGAFTVTITWYAPSASQVLSYEILDAGVSVTSGTVTAINADQLYQPDLIVSHSFSNYPVVRLWNADTTRNTTAFIREVSIHQ